MAAAPDAPCGPPIRNVSLISSTRPCNHSAVRTSPYTLHATAAFAVAITSMMILTIVGNILVIMAVLTSRSLKVPQNLYLVSLAAADILVATLIIPFSLANELQGYWAFGALWCEIYLALDVLFCTSSIVHLCAIALDRYLSISRPVSYGAKRSPSRIKAGIVVVWLISAVISFPPLLTLDKSEGGEEVCELNSERWYILYSTIGSFFAPCVIMVLVYARIYQIAKQHTRCLPGQKGNARGRVTSRVASAKPVMKLSEQPELNTTTSSSLQTSQLHPAPAQTLSPSSSVPRGDRQAFTAKSQERPAEDHTSSSGSELDVGEEGLVGEEENKAAEQTPERRQSKGVRVQVVNLSSRYKSTVMTSSGSRLAPEGAAEVPGTSGAGRRKALASREKRLTFVLAVVMGVFVICWFPFFFSYSLQAVCPSSCSIPNPLFKFFFWIGYCNSCLNPVIYTVFNKDFRRAFKRILCRDMKGTSF